VHDYNSNLGKPDILARLWSLKVGDNTDCSEISKRDSGIPIDVKDPKGPATLTEELPPLDLRQDHFKHGILMAQGRKRWHVALKCCAWLSRHYCLGSWRDHRAQEENKSHLQGQREVCSFNYDSAMLTWELILFWELHEKKRHGERRKEAENIGLLYFIHHGEVVRNVCIPADFWEEPQIMAES